MIRTGQDNTMPANFKPKSPGLASKLKSASLSMLFNAKVIGIGMATMIGTVVLGTLLLQPILTGVVGASVAHGVVLGLGLGAAIWNHNAMTRENKLSTPLVVLRNASFLASGFTGATVAGYSLMAMGSAAGPAAVGTAAVATGGLATPVAIACGLGIAALNAASLGWRGPAKETGQVAGKAKSKTISPR